MSGRVIQALRSCPQIRWLTGAEQQTLAGCSRMRAYLPGEVVLHARDTALCVLRQGRVALDLQMRTEGERCGGEATLELSAPGTAFGWGMWIRSARIAVSVRAVTGVIIVRFDLDCHLCDTSFAALGRRMALQLYGLLQESGLCPPNVQALLALAESYSAEGE